MLLLGLGINLIGDWLRDVPDPRMERRIKEGSAMTTSDPLTRKGAGDHVGGVLLELTKAEPAGSGGWCTRRDSAGPPT
jgi:hypothetical protein